MEKIINKRDGKARVHEETLGYTVYIHEKKSLVKSKTFERFQDAQNLKIAINSRR